MPIRLSGMNSGLDTDAIVKALVTGYSTKKDNYKKSQTKLDWTRDAWKSLNTKVYGLYSKVSNLRFSSAYSLKKTTVSDNTKATVTASSDAVNGSQKLNILQVAQAGYMTGGKLDKGTTNTTTLAELGYTQGKASVNVVKGDGSTQTVSFESTDTVQSVLNQFKEAGLNASFDTNNSRIYLSAKEAGKDNDFNLVSVDEKGAAALSALGLNTSLYKTDTNGQKVLTQTGQAYQNYASYATAADGSILSDEDIKNKVSSGLLAYENATKANADASTQLANVNGGITYAKSYANVQQYYADHKVSATDQKRFAAVMGIDAGSRDNALVTSSGEVYTKTSGVDTKGNAVYGYVDDKGNKKYVSKESTFLDKSTNITYRKNENGELVGKDASGAEAIYKGDTSLLEEKIVYHTVTEKSKTEKVSGEDVTTYTYESASDSLTLKTVADAYEDYKSELVLGEKLSEEDAEKALSGFYGNLATVNAYEKAAKETESVAYSKENIVNQVQTAYKSSGAAGVEALINGKDGFTTKVAEFKSAVNTSQSVMDDNQTLAELAGLTGTERTQAIDDMAQRAKAAANALAAAKLGETAGAIKMDGQNAIITLNDVQYENATNAIEVNGLTINAQAVTGPGDDNAITITTATDVQGIYDKIKEFLTEYNSIINEMTKLYNAGSAKGYEPLTDEQKDEMSDTEIEKWESKIKDSLLRHDSGLNDIMTTMTNAMSRSIAIGDKSYSLSSFGISTLGFLNSAANEHYAYHIDGDADDSSASGKKDKLMAAITSDPETVTQFFQKLADNLYNAVGDKMKSTTLSSVYTIYNDKQMDKQYNEYTKLISEWEDRISQKEEYYYKKFSSMESALSKLNSTQSSLGGYFGQ